MQGREVELGGLEPKKPVDAGVDSADSNLEFGNGIFNTAYGNFETVYGKDKQNRNGSAKKKSKVIWIVILVVVILAIGGGAAMMILRPWEGENDGNDVVSNEELTSEARDESDDEADEPASEVTTESPTDDELAQELFERFGGEVLELGSGTDIYGLQSGGTVSDEIMFGIIMQKMNDEVGDDYSRHGLDACARAHDDNGVILVAEGAMDCFSGERIRSEAWRMFGRSIELKPGYIRYSGSMWDYDVEADELYFAGGLSGSRQIYRALYMTERVDNRIYLYENVVIPIGFTCEGGSRDGSDACRQMRVSDGTDVDIDVVLTLENMVQYKDVLDRYKWTFVDDGSGNYIFESIEKL